MKENSPKSSQRLLSLDTLRGFDMLFIMGLSGLIVSVCKFWPDCGFASWLSGQMGHVSWDGFKHHDTIFPLFLFIAGISFPFSFAKQKAGGLSTGRICGRIVYRGLMLFLLGLVYNGLFKLEFETLRIPSVLGRIGFAWMFAALLFVKFGLRTRIVIAAAILVGYGLLLTIPAPDAGDAALWTREGNLVGYVDRMLLPQHIYWRGVMDPEGILSTLPAVVTAMLGMFTGELVRTPEERLSGGRKALYMAVGVVVLLVAALVWNRLQPINKTMWTSAFVCAAGAYSLGMFALFYWIIDVKGWRRWTYFFKVVGVNSITIYLGQRIIGFGGISKYFVGGLASKCPELWGNVILGVGYIAVCWLFLYFLDRHKVYLKV